MQSPFVAHSGEPPAPISPAAPASNESPPLVAPVPALPPGPLPPLSPLPPLAPAFPVTLLATQTWFTHSVSANCGPRLVQSCVTWHWLALSSKNSEQPLLASNTGTQASKYRVFTRFS